MLRSLLERLSRDVVLVRRLPNEFGGLSLFVSPDASLRFWKRDLAMADPLLLEAAKALVHPGDGVWDVGANVGLFSFAAASLSGDRGRVLAIEPDPWLCNLLRRSAELNASLPCAVSVLQVAVTDRTGDVILKIARRGRAANYLAGREPSTQTGGIRNAIQVPSVTLDRLLDNWPAPAVVKIDVEGAEDSVLRGAQRLLKQVRPRILCEVSSVAQTEVSAAFHAAGYAIYDAAKPAEERVRIRHCAWNTIALPVEAAPDGPSGD